MCLRSILSLAPLFFSGCAKSASAPGSFVLYFLPRPCCATIRRGCNGRPISRAAISSKIGMLHENQAQMRRNKNGTKSRARFTFLWLKRWLFTAGIFSGSVITRVWICARIEIQRTYLFVPITIGAFPFSAPTFCLRNLLCCSHAAAAAAAAELRALSKAKGIGEKSAPLHSVSVAFCSDVFVQDCEKRMKGAIRVIVVHLIPPGFPRLWAVKQLIFFPWYIKP